MKIILAAFALLALPATARAEEEKAFDFLKSNPGFWKTYLQCGPARQAAKRNSPELLTCEQKVSLKHCEWAESLSDPVQKKIELDLACDYMAGEMKGDKSEHDKEVMMSFKLAGCFELSGKTVEMAREYWGKENDLRALLFLADDYTNGMDECYKQRVAAEKAEAEKPAPKTEEKKAEEKPAEPVKTEAPKPAAAPVPEAKPEAPKTDASAPEKK